MRATVGLVALVGCGRSGEIDFPDQLAPLEENKADWPAPAGGEDYPEVLEIVSGGDSDLWWAHGRGYVRTPPGLVWASARVPDAGVDRREVDEYEVEFDTVPGFDDSYTIHCVVNDVITVDYDLTWVHELQKGTETAPERVVAQWDKTDGTPFIEILSGSLVLEPDPDDPTVTRVELIEHLKASLRDDETIAQFLRDLHETLVALSHGDSLPTFD